jgi:transcription elongation GreA/GreB family factor
MVRYRGRWHLAKKVNQKTVNVPSGYSWDDKVPMNQITSVRNLSDMSEDELRRAVETLEANAASDQVSSLRKQQDAPMLKLFRDELNRRA